MIRVNLIGRLGNNLFQFAHARALADSRNEPLSYSPWIGEKIFDLPASMPDGYGDVVSGYCQDQASLIYTRTQARAWFKFKPEIQEKLDKLKFPKNEMIAHLRVGDYTGIDGYVVISPHSYVQAASSIFGYGVERLVFVSEETQATDSGFSEEMGFLPDFYRMMCAEILFRANSSFSWWAAVLGNPITYSPVIKGIRGGKNDVNFVLGNHSALSHHEFCTDLFLQE